MTMEQAIAEVRWARAHGAVGVFKKGNGEAGRSVTDPYFAPLYQVADDLDMAVCFHTGSGIPNSRATRTRNTAQGSRVPFANLPETFSAVITNKLPQKFPHIRWGFIEAASGWIPYELYRIN